MVCFQYTVPTLCDLFANGLHQPELSSAWSVCLEEIRASYDAKDNRPSQTPHGPGYPQSDLPPDGVTILQRPQHNARREENEVCETQEAIDAAKRELGKILPNKLAINKCVVTYISIGAQAFSII